MEGFEFIIIVIGIIALYNWYKSGETGNITGKTTPAGISVFPVTSALASGGDTIRANIVNNWPEQFRVNVYIKILGAPKLPTGNLPVIQFITDICKRQIDILLAKGKNIEVIDVRPNTDGPGFTARVLIDGIDLGSTLSSIFPEIPAPILAPPIGQKEPGKSQEPVLNRQPQPCLIGGHNGYHQPQYPIRY